MRSNITMPRSTFITAVRPDTRFGIPGSAYGNSNVPSSANSAPARLGSSDPRASIRSASTSTAEFVWVAMSGFRSQGHRGQSESLVVIHGDLVTFRAVGSDPTDVGQEHPRLAWDIRTQVPGVAANTQRPALGDSANMLDPCVLCSFRRLDGSHVPLIEPGDAVGDPVDVLLDRVNHVGGHRWALRAADTEHVREPGDADPQVGARTPRPSVTQCQLFATDDVNG